MNKDTDVNEKEKIGLAKETLQKEAEVRAYNIENQHSNMLKQQETVSKVESIDIGNLGEGYFETQKSELRDYLTDAKNSGVFLNNHFRGKEEPEPLLMEMLRNLCN